jgi:hypothetical protein
VKAIARTCIALLLPLALACSNESDKAVFARREVPQFKSEVYPVLLRDCAFPACHGDPKRFFRVWGPGRVRLPGTSGTPAEFDLPSINEISATHALALSMIDEHDLAKSPLLRKPLAQAAGGAGHLGVDKHGRDVYRTAQDAGYLAIARWVYSPPPPQTPAKTAP